MVCIAAALRYYFLLEAFLTLPYVAQVYLLSTDDGLSEKFKVGPIGEGWAWAQILRRDVVSW